MWHVPLAQVWTHYNVGWRQCMTLFCKVYLYPIAKSFQQHQRHITIPSTWIEWLIFKCYHVLNWFFLLKPGLLKFIWIFSSRTHLKIKCLPHSESKILPNKFHEILLIKIFPTTPKAHSNSSKIFSYDLI